MGKTQAELLNPVTGLSRDDLVEWMAYKRMKPFGYDAENRQIGAICAAIHNSAGKSYKENVRWDDFFLPSWEEPEEKEEHTGKFGIGTLETVFAAIAVTPDQAKKIKEENRCHKE